MNEDLKQAIADEVSAQLQAFLADVVMTWDEQGAGKAMFHGHPDPGRAMCAAFGDVLHIAMDRRESALTS